MKIKCFIMLIWCFCKFDNYLMCQSIIEDKGKYGIADENGKVILQPRYEVVKYYPYRLKNFFLVRQNYKYAYVYKVTHSYKPEILEGNSVYQKSEELASPYWVVSDFEYDAIDPLFNFKRKYVSELFMKYKKDGMYGLIHIESRGESKSMAFTELYHHNLGKNTVFPPIYNQIFFSDNSIFPVQKNDKFGFIFNEKSDCTDSFYVNNTEIKYDEIPRHLSYNTDERTYTIRIKENQKYGLLKFDYDGCKPKYQIPCECKTEVKQVYNSFQASPFIFVCKETEAHTMVIYNEEDKQRFELPAMEKDEGVFRLLNTKNGNKYVLIEYRNDEKVNKEIDQLKRYKNIYIVDVKNEKMKISFLGDKKMSYENYTIEGMPLIMRKTKTDNGFSYDFFDIETGQILFSIPPAKKGYHYNFEPNFNYKSLLVLYYKTGKGLKKKVGYYDYETKTYTKGKCKKCE